MNQAQWHALADALLMLESELRSLGLWSSVSPEAADLRSAAPFYVDTLDFEQWLQWVFIPRMVAIVNQQDSLQADCNIRPMAEEAFRHLGRRQLGLLSAIGEVDRLASLLTHSQSAPAKKPQS